MKKFMTLVSSFLIGCTSFAQQDVNNNQQGSCSIAAEFESGVSPSCNLDLKRYMGKWYEQAHLPTFFQKECNSSTAEYSINDDGSVKVLNTCLKSDGSINDIVGKAKLDPKDPSGRSLLVSFNWITDIVNFFKGVNYYVYFVDDFYKFAVVGTPKKDMLWVLTRDEFVDNDTLQQLLKIAQDSGFDLSTLIYDVREPKN